MTNVSDITSKQDKAQALLSGATPELERFLALDRDAKKTGQHASSLDAVIRRLLQGEPTRTTPPHVAYLQLPRSEASELFHELEHLTELEAPNIISFVAHRLSICVSMCIRALVRSRSLGNWWLSLVSRRLYGCGYPCVRFLACTCRWLTYQ